jgi:taurine--2-oxoglutarate transaminase
VLEPGAQEQGHYRAEPLNQFFFSTSGTEANDGALIMTRQSKAPAYKIVSRYHSYHGATSGGLSFTGDPRRWPAEQARYTVQGVRFAPDNYCYRCPFKMSYPECDIQCARYLDYLFKEEGNVAAFIVEPVVGTNGRIVPPPEYFPIVRQICDENDVLLIADEVMSGWFRTGTDRYGFCHAELEGCSRHHDNRQRRQQCIHPGGDHHDHRKNQKPFRR